jgi:hypothetical protein
VLLILSAAVAGLALLAAVPFAGASGSAPSPSAAHVRPSQGGPRTAFTVTVRIPAQTGTIGQFRRFDSLSVTGPSRRGCVGSAERPLPARAAGSIVRLRLAPGRRAHWCTGTYHGLVTQSQTVTCGGGPQMACTMMMIRPQTIGRFRFVVRRR